MKKVAIVLFVALSSAAALAQTPTPAPQKIGFADWNYIFSQLPEYKQIDNELKTHGTQLENQLKAKYQDYETKVKAFQSMPATTSDVIKADKERELVALQENIQKFQQDAQTSIQKKQVDLMQPVYTKVGKAIEDVAKEQGFAFIINPQTTAGDDILLFSDEKFDISNSVLKKLGVTPTAPATK
ncbi:MAG: OmpH family outer membrane protein [Bacteroidetes bacterium]|nr:OmpH family outer membrane protein [Bacteroidota bacterium]